MNRERAIARIEATIGAAVREARQTGQLHEQFLVRALSEGFAVLIDELDDGPMRRAVARALTSKPQGNQE